MPGTIEVSVLDFGCLKSSSSSSFSSPLSVKVSIGRNEYQTMGEGEFSFPVKTLRENLIVTLLDAEGNAISHTGIKTMMIIEKGVWEDIFPLEGGGHVHMKLQFILTEEDRIRISNIRESALKKKYGESLDGGLRCAGNATAVISDESKACLPRVEAMKAADISVQDNQIIYTNPYCNRTEENSLKAPVPKEVEHCTAERELVEKFRDLSPENDGQESSPCSGETSGCSKSAKVADNSSTFLNKESCMEDICQKSSKEKTRSNVRKMISAFENSSTQNARSQIKPQSKSSQLSWTNTKQFQKDSYIKEGKIGKSGRVLQSSKMVMEFSQSVESQQMLNKFSKRKEQFGLHKTLDETQPLQVTRQLEATPSTQLVQSNACHLGSRYNDLEGENIITMEEERQSLGNLIQNPNIDTASGRAWQDINVKESTNNKLKFVAYLGSFESSGAWIFPDESTPLCLTTSSKKLMDLIGGDCNTEEKYNQEDKNTPPPQFAGEEIVGCADIKVTKCEEASPKLRKLKLLSSADVQQAIKIAIMVGFGILVLLTREKNKMK